MEHITNQITLRGSLASLPRVSHENHGRKFYRFTLEVPRLSSTVDLLPVIAEASLVDGLDPSGGEMITVTGQVRSHNVRTDGVRHLLIFVFASSVVCEDGEPVNEVILEGPLCKDPVYRRTPLGREICDVMLAVNRPYQRADYIPCIFWGRTAMLAGECCVGDEIALRGRFQSRNYLKVLDQHSEKRNAYEVSVMSAEF